MDKTEALSSAMKNIEKQFGKGAVMRLGDDREKIQMQIMSTGILPIDMAIGIGGLPRGRIIEIYGAESSGKTTVALHIVAEVQRQGGTAMFIDAEHAIDPSYAESIGVNINSLIFSQQDSGEQALEILDSMVRSSAVDVVVVDSVAALVPQAEIDGDMGASHVGLHARMMSQAMRKLAGNISRTNTIAIFINQMREKVGVMFGNPEVTTGGRALKFYATVRMEVRKGEVIKNGSDVIGNRTRVKITKNKVAPPLKQAEFDIIYGEGFSRMGMLIDMGVDYGFVTKGGSYYTYKDIRIQGRENFREFFKTHPQRAAELDKELRDKIFGGLEIDIPREEVIEEMPEDYDEPDYVDTEEEVAPVNTTASEKKSAGRKRTTTSRKKSKVEETESVASEAKAEVIEAEVSETKEVTNETEGAASETAE